MIYKKKEIKKVFFFSRKNRSNMLKVKIITIILFIWKLIERKVKINENGGGGQKYHLKLPKV